MVSVLHFLIVRMHPCPFCFCYCLHPQTLHSSLISVIRVCRFDIYASSHYYYNMLSHERQELLWVNCGIEKWGKSGMLTPARDTKNAKCMKHTPLLRFSSCATLYVYPRMPRHVRVYANIIAFLISHFCQ